MNFKKIIMFLNLILFLSTTNSYAKDVTSPAALDWWCSAILIRTVGLIKQNVNKFSGDARSSLISVSNHLDNNGMLLMQKAAMGKITAKDAAERSNAGMDWANQNIGNNVLLVLKKGSKPNKIILSCLSRN